MTVSDAAAVFAQEAEELLEALEQGLLDLEHRPADAELVNAVFRALHTLKGSGAMFGHLRLAAFLHEFESAFDQVRQGVRDASPGLVAVALVAKDHAAGLVAEGEGEGGDPEGALILETLRNALSGEATPSSPPVSAPAAAPADRASGWRVRFGLTPDALLNGADPLRLIEELRELGEAEVEARLADVPTLEALDPEVCALSWEVRLATGQPLEAVQDVFMFLAEDTPLTIAPLEAAAVAEEPPAVAGPDAGAAEPAPEAERTRAQAAAPRERGASVRVPAERLDDLMARVGELVIAQARLNRLAGESADPNLKTIAEEMERLSSGLRDTTMEMRMVPIGSIFGRFRRLVHDLSSSLGKEVEFETAGEETELDKTVIEQLADPLVHLIRNSMDHGLEEPERRRLAGKSATCRLRLAAAHAGAEVAITLSDDGAGLNSARIRAKAEEAGLLASDAQIAEPDLHRLIFEPGFSTAREVTSLSGRGVGMDVVKRTIEGLRGSIDVASSSGKGATVTLRLPLTLAIIDGLLVRVGAERYVIPLSAVEECVELPATADEAAGRSFLNIRGRLVPFLRLRRLFGSDAPPELHQKVVVISSGDLRVGLVVDQILGDSQAVIKQLSRLHAGLKTFSGATILGDGAVALILDVMNLVAFGQAQEARGRTQPLERVA